MSTDQRKKLKEKLEKLQCHFTWQLGVVDIFNPPHVLQKLAVEIEHTTNENKVALLGLQAYLYQLNEKSEKALQSLETAEKHNRGENSEAVTAGSLVIQGNYAWIYYHQGLSDEAKSALDQVQKLWDAKLIPYLQAQKGWSLLAVRTGHGGRARECFETALMVEPQNKDFRAGLAKALYFSWSYFGYPDTAIQARSHLQDIVKDQSGNYRAKIYLAMLLEQVDKEKRIDLLEECLKESSDPEVLKCSALSWLSQSVEEAIEIIQKALQKNPKCHLLYQALAKCYKKQWRNTKEEDRDNIRDKAIEQLEKIVQEHEELDLTLVQLQLAELIGDKDPAQEEKIYKDLKKDVGNMSLRCRQALYLYWGNLFLYKKKKGKESAKDKFMEGYKIPVPTEQREKCEWQLRKMACIYKERGDSDSADAIHKLLRDNKHGPPKESSGLGKP